MPVAHAGEVDLSYQRSGSGPPLLLVSGMGGTYSHWGEPFLAPLREDFDTIAYDHRGVGQSSRMEAPFTIAQLAADAAGLLAALEVESAHVLGISMGGMVAQELALAHPQRVRTLALGCTYCGGDGSLLAPPTTAQRLAESVRSGDRERAVRIGWEITISAPMVDDADAFAAYLDLCLRRRVAQVVIVAQMRAIAAHDTSARLSQLAPPTMIVHGTADQLIPVENAHVIAGHLPHARLELLDGVGHRFYWEEPRRSAALVRDHVAVHV
jgi:3-oxoadipate enol-lactonase